MNWRDLSYAIIFAMLVERKIPEGIGVLLHPDAYAPFKYILSTLASYSYLPNEKQMVERFNLHWEHHYKSGYSIDHLIDLIRPEKIKNDANHLIAKIQSLVTANEPKKIQDYLNEINKFQNLLYDSASSEVFRLSDYGNILNYYFNGQNDKVIANYGFPQLDKFTGGITEGQYIILYANTSQGKSTLARAIAGNIAISGGRVLYLTLEESGRKSVAKTISHISRVSANKIMDNMLTPDSYSRLTSVGKIPGEVVFIDRVESKTITEVNRLAQQYNPQIIIVDQLPLWTKNGDQSWEAIGAASKMFKDFTQLKKIPVIALTQAVRKTKIKEGLEGTMAFAYSVAQDADVAVFLHPDEDGPGYKRKRLELLKNRDRQRGQVIELKWQLESGIIEEEESVFSYGSTEETKTERATACSETSFASSIQAT